MTYATVMVNLEIGCSNAGVMNAAADLAGRFGAGVIGIAACHPMPILYTDGYYVPQEMIEQDREQIRRDISAAEAEFRDTMRGRAKAISWRSNVTMEPLAAYIAGEARGADIVVTAASADTPSDLTRRVNPSDLLMQMGRPVLVVPAAVTVPKLDRVLVAWKDAREPRRAVMDALPLLQKASHVAVASIAAADDLEAARDHVADVIAWLATHGVTAIPVITRPLGDDAAQLQAIAREQEAGVIVAGAYGHSRLREWALGGVTRHLLLHGQGCALLSH
jgi:nucleotide-binding universal stress UspA family protein